jgi:hypothetical protein
MRRREVRPPHIAGSSAIGLMLVRHRGQGLGHGGCPLVVHNVEAVAVTTSQIALWLDAYEKSQLSACGGILARTENCGENVSQMD